MYRRLCRFSLCTILTTVVVCSVLIYYLLFVDTVPAKPKSHDFGVQKSHWLDNNESTMKSNVVSNELQDKTKSKNYVDVLILFTKARGNDEMGKKLRLCLKSLLNYTTIPIKLHVIGDEFSQRIARKIFSKSLKLTHLNISVVYHDVEEISTTLHAVVSNMQRHFSYKPGTYYSDVIFFLSMALHQVFSEKRIVMVDIDVMFTADILELYEEFYNFNDEAVIGLAFEQQPVYRHVFQLYRMNNSDPSIGDPPSGGFPGFNSGVLLLNLERMRNSVKYNQLLNDIVVDELVQKYHFRGHLGDQDFFTLVGIEHMELFHVLSCGWNRQLCQWWRNHGYESIFNSFYECNDTVKIIHGNCNTPIKL